MKSREIYELYRYRIQNENELINFRMSWFVPLQSFLFVSLAIFSNGKLVLLIGHWFVLGVSAVGVVSSFVTWISVASAISAMRRLEQSWDEIPMAKFNRIQFPSLMGALSNGSKEPVLILRLLRKFGATRRFNGTLISYFLPLATLAFWVMLGVFGFTMIEGCRSNAQMPNCSLLLPDQSNNE